MNRILEIQGLRALAALLVVLYHADFVPGGFIGVDIFYVISGYLITGLILRQIQETGSLDLKNFYQRRIKRLLPASVLVLIITAAISYLILPPIGRAELGRNVLAVGLLVSNYAFALWETDYQNLGAEPSALVHYWSLAVEEQFYLIWPIFILLISRMGLRKIKWAIFSTFVISLLFSIWHTQNSSILAFYSLHTRAWELAAGALILFIPKSFTLKFVKTQQAAFLLGLALLTCAIIFFNSQTPFPGAAALVPVIGTFLLINSIGNWPKPAANLSNHKITQWLGAISYSLYLWHWPVLLLPSIYLDRPLVGNEKTLCVIVTIILAHLTYRFVEQPIRYANLDTKTVYKTVVASFMTIALISVVIISTSTTKIYIKEVNKTFDLIDITAQPIVYSDGCHAGYGEINSASCAYGDLSSSKSIVLFGDSHAAQWFEPLNAIATRDGYKLISLTKSACAAFELPRVSKGLYNKEECASWQRNSIKRIKELRPEFVIVSTFSRYYLYDKNNQKENFYVSGQKDLYNKLNDYSGELIYISDTPKPVKDIPKCLSNSPLKSCDDVDRSSNKVYEGFVTIDPYIWFCKGGCKVINGNYVVYRDASHISSDAAKAVTNNLRNSLIKARLLN
jgi:peptidoglycan/LPS O-acetylase OafA/YrhL